MCMFLSVIMYFSRSNLLDENLNSGIIQLIVSKAEDGKIFL